MEKTMKHHKLTAHNLTDEQFRITMKAMSEVADIICAATTGSGANTTSFSCGKGKMGMFLAWKKESGFTPEEAEDLFRSKVLAVPADKPAKWAAHLVETGIHIMKNTTTDPTIKISELYNHSENN